MSEFQLLVEQASQAGRTAFAEGLGLEKNPYHPDHDLILFRRWVYGWNNARVFKKMQEADQLRYAGPWGLHNQW